MGKLIDLTNKRFGRLVVTSRAPNKNKSTMWNVVCDCGNTKVVDGNNLKRGKQVSCGCYNNELRSKALTIDETNNVYGKLIVLERSYEKESSNNRAEAHWLCQCSCGNKKIIRGSDLRSGNTQSCGCVNSWANHHIQKLLETNGISFSPEWSFEDLRGKDKKLRFDFAIFKDNELSHLIEYDGDQHKNIDNPWNNKTIVKHDKLKNQYCETNGIELRRFSGGYKSITLEDLI